MSGSTRRPSVLVVDDQEVSVDFLLRVLVGDGYTVATASNGDDALAVVASTLPDLVLLDVVMPGPDGFDVCRRLKSDPRTRIIPVVLLTGLQGPADRLRGIEAGADDFLSKPIELAELRARTRSLVRLKRHTDELDSAAQVIVSLAMTIEARDRYTEGHCRRLARYAVRLGEQIGLPQADLEALYRGGFMHDLGKVAIPDAILLKPGHLSRTERAVMETHTVTGDGLCDGLNALRDVRPIVRHHHERLDGSGYPDRLLGDAISLLAQILGVVDVFDALTTDRPYRRAWASERALIELREEAGRGWRQSALVETFADLIDRRALTTSAVDRPTWPATAAVIRRGGTP